MDDSLIKICYRFILDHDAYDEKYRDNFYNLNEEVQQKVSYTFYSANGKKRAKN